ncbi:phage major capsid protein [Ancylobacter sp. FA202]|uniref:phage major capsid protein n=1 Tax=Ancylobacter sp. FA202 TaxID=1111106 RepID=UPI00037809FD|nr:phage major capsid protein [Ancylobacter sp. FA202]
MSLKNALNTAAAGPAPSAILRTAAAGDAAPTVDELTEAFEQHNEAVNASMATLRAENASLRHDVERLGTAVRPAVGRGIGPASPNQADDHGDPARVKRHRAALVGYMRTGDEATLRVDNKAAGVLSTDDDPSGGFLVPDEVSRQILTLQRNVSPIRRLARIVTSTSSAYKQPISKGGTAAGWVGEKDDRNDTEGPDLGMLSVPANELYAMPITTQKLLDDAMIDVAGWLESEITTTFAEMEGVAFVTGNGVEKPLGFLSKPTSALADDDRSIEFYQHVAAGSVDQLSCDALINIVYTLKAGYRSGASWLMNSTTIADVAKLRDGEDRPIWIPSIAQGVPPLLLGYPVVADENMPDVASGACPIAFGDFARGYVIVDRVDVRILRDPFTKKGFVKFYATKRVGGSPQDTRAIKFLKMSVSG